jgi:hypothetical protein
MIWTSMGLIMLIRNTSRLALATIALVAMLATASIASASTPATGVLRTGLPNHILTPGAFNPAVTQATIHTTICVSGWTTKVRPPTSYTTPLKRNQLVAYGYADRTLSHYEEDHLVSLELGGSPRSIKNLWPEPHHVKVGGLDLGSYTKDGFENYLRRRICAGSMTLAKARAEIETNWVRYWKAAGKPRG